MKLFQILCLSFTLLLNVQVNGLSYQFGDLSKGIAGAVTGIVGKVPDVIPTPIEFFQSTKNVAAGYPFDVTFRIINAFCK